MLPIHLETNWIYKAAQITRIGWFIFHLVMFVLYLSSASFYWLLMPLFLTAFLIPQWSGVRANSFGVKNYPVLEFIFSGLFYIVACYLSGNYSSFLAIPALCAGLYTKPGKLRWALWLGFSLAPLLAILSIGIDYLSLGVIEGFMFFGIGIAVSKVLEAEKKTQMLLEENRRQNQLLEEYAKEVERMTLLEERDRLAKELHDTIGHTYTSVIMGLDAASFLLVKSPEKAQEQINLLSGVMRKSLDEVRGYIHQISPKEDREEVSIQLKKIANEFALHTKTEIHFEQNGAYDSNLSSQGTLTLIRCLQEGLTNAVRHGRAKKITITLEEKSSYVFLTIKDDGIGISNVNFGFGLNGMKERLESLQGGLKMESKENAGTVITCFLPVLVDRFMGEGEHNDKSINYG